MAGTEVKTVEGTGFVVTGTDDGGVDDGVVVTVEGTGKVVTGTVKLVVTMVSGGEVVVVTVVKVVSGGIVDVDGGGSSHSWVTVRPTDERGGSSPSIRFKVIVSPAVWKLLHGEVNLPVSLSTGTLRTSTPLVTRLALFVWVDR